MVYRPNKAIHPGYLIARALEREGMTQRSLSERTGLTEKHISQIINGEASITVETALLLENALGGAASFWINLEKDFQETKVRIERVPLLKKEVELVKKFPYTELSKRGYVEFTTNNEKRVENMWRFFAVNSLNFVQNTEPVSFRKRSGFNVKSEAISTWLRCGEIEAKKQTLGVYSETSLKKSLKDLRSITRERAEQFSAATQNILNRAGVALVYTPHFPGTGVSGAVRWTGEIPILQLSLLGKYADMFWFSLFHEIGHLILHGKKEKFIEFDTRNLSTTQNEEFEADEFATRELIPEESFEVFVSRGDYSKPAISKFAEEQNIHPGIVAGRLCHEGLVGWSEVASLRPRLKFV